LIRAVNRGRHADNVLEADTPLAKRPSTVATGVIGRFGRFPDPLQGNNRWEGWRDHVYGAVTAR
jgi:hypothetical protein